MKIYLDGKWVGRDAAKISVFDHGLLYGDGVFEGIRAYDGHIFRLKQHIDRLYRSARLIQLTIPLTPARMTAVVRETLRKNNLRDSYIRLVVTRGVGNLGLDPRKCPVATVFVIADKLAMFPPECYENGLSAIVAKTRRNLVEALDPTIKSLNYLNNILAKIEANRKGVPEAIMLNAAGHVSECTGDNVFFVKSGRVFTPPVSAGVLKGVTREVVFEIAREKKGRPVTERLFKPAELFAADEVFFTGTAAEVIPVTKIDGRRIGDGRPGPVTLELIRRFRALIRREGARAR